MPFSEEGVRRDASCIVADGSPLDVRKCATYVCAQVLEQLFEIVVEQMSREWRATASLSLGIRAKLVPQLRHDAAGERHEA